MRKLLLVLTFGIGRTNSWDKQIKSTNKFTGSKGRVNLDLSALSKGVYSVQMTNFTTGQIQAKTLILN